MGESVQWRPHSMGEAAGFEHEFCFRCGRETDFRAGSADACNIAAQGFGVSIGLNPPPEWQVGPNGPHCTAFAPETPTSAETERGSVVGNEAVQGIGHANGTNPNKINALSPQPKDKENG